MVFPDRISLDLPIIPAPRCYTADLALLSRWNAQFFHHPGYNREILQTKSVKIHVMCLT